MPAKKPAKDRLSVLLQVRVFPSVKKDIDEYNEKMRKETGLNYGYQDFLRQAIHDRLKQPFKKI